MVISNINRNYNTFFSLPTMNPLTYPLACLNPNVEAIGQVDKKVLLANNLGTV